MVETRAIFLYALTHRLGEGEVGAPACRVETRAIFLYALTHRLGEGEVGAPACRVETRAGPPAGGGGGGERQGQGGVRVAAVQHRRELWHKRRRHKLGQRARLQTCIHTCSNS